MSKENVVVIITCLVYILAFFIAWHELKILYDDPLSVVSLESRSIISIIDVVLTLALITLPAAFLITVNVQRKKRLFMYAVGGLTSIIVFYRTPLIAVVLIIGTYMSYLIFDHFSSADLHNQIEPKPLPTFRRQLKTLLTIMAVFISIGYYTTFTQETVSRFTIEIPERLVTNVISQFVEGTEEGEPLVNKQQIIDQQFEERVRPEILKQIKEAGITDQTIIEQQLERAKRSFEQRASEQLQTMNSPQNQADFISSVTEEVENNINNLINNYQKYLPVIFTLSLFALIQFIDPLVSYLASIILYTLLKLLKAVGVVHVEINTAEVKVLSL